MLTLCDAACQRAVVLSCNSLKSISDEGCTNNWLEGPHKGD